ncbi:MAG: hypothetical protein MZV70_30620 [Desulfobacterales bacterium]|nr:hypothetical protein [Desulfobacterales bacterium]
MSAEKILTIQSFTRSLRRCRRQTLCHGTRGCHPSSGCLCPGYGTAIAYGASPRASISLILGAKAMALLAGRGFTLEDVKAVAHDVLRALDHPDL